MVSGRAALCCDVSFDRNFPTEKMEYGNVFEIGVAGVWANLTREHQLIYDQTFSKKKLKLICNDCDRCKVSSDTSESKNDLAHVITHQQRQHMKFFA